MPELRADQPTLRRLRTLMSWLRWCDCGYAPRTTTRRQVHLVVVLFMVLLEAAGTPVRAEDASEEDIWSTAETYDGETDQASDETDGAGDDGVWEGTEVLYVEAARRVQDLQQVAESVTAFTDSDLLDRGLVNLNDLQFNVPNLFSGDGISKITLRGVGSEISGPGVDAGFAVHVNGVYSARDATALTDFFDVARVDVLRGPQGTLWGRNSTGGALNIITHRPIHDFDWSSDVEYESFAEGAESVRLRGMVNLPLVEDELAARVAFVTNFNEGLTLNESETNDQRVNDAQDFSLRASLRWQPTDRFTLDFIGSMTRADEAGPLAKFDGPFTNAPTPASLGTGPGLDYTGALPNPSSPYRTSVDEAQSFEQTTYTATLIAGWEADTFKIESITGYQSLDSYLHRDADGSSLPIATLDLTDVSRQISQEFLLHSTWDKSVNYTLGANYQYDWTPKTEIFTPNSQNTDDSRGLRLVPNLLITTLVDGCTPFVGTGCPPVKPVGEAREDFVRAFSRADNRVLGIYGNVEWEIVPDLTLGAGARYSYTHRDWDDKTRAQTFAATSSSSGLLVLQLGRQRDRTWEAGTWKVTIDYRTADAHLLWASVGTGSRAGGFNFSDERAFDEERIFAVEGGLKSNFLGRRVTLNVTGFWYDWEDPQILGSEDGIPLTTNAPSAESYGIEVEAKAFATENLVLNGSFGWLEAVYDEQFLAPDRTAPNFAAPISGRFPDVDIEGNRLPRSPRFTVSAGAQYDFDLDDWGRLTPRVDFYYRDAFSFAQFDNPLDEQSSYTRTDLRLIWISPSERFRVEAFVRNLEDERVKTNQEVFSSIHRFHYYDTPRSGGIRIGAKY